MASVYLETERLILRPPRAADIGRFVPLLNDFEVVKNLSRVPYPYSEDDGCAWILKSAWARARGEDYPFAILKKTDGAYLGACGYHPLPDGEIGYWLGRPYWGKGYASEAVARLVLFVFEELGAEAIGAGWFQDNPASGRVLEKLGFEPAGGDTRACLSRGTAVFCHKVVLTRAAFAKSGQRA